MKKLNLLMLLLANTILFGQDKFALESRIKDFQNLETPKNWHSSNINKEYYLDMMEPIVRMAAEWVDKDGAVIDPYLKSEWNQTSSRFVSSAAVLLHFGRIKELQSTVEKVMSRACRRLSEPATRGKSPDFWLRELATGYELLAPLVPKETLNKWRKDLNKVVPEENYSAVDKSGKKIPTFHNWVVYSSAGECMRENLNIGGKANTYWGYRFFDRYMKPQIAKFDHRYGMYRDPGDPMTYDITTRLQVACALKANYRGKYYSVLDELLRKGGITTLFFMPPQNIVPFGGRSAGFHFQEGIISALCEYEAIRYKESNPHLAGIFKRQAHLAAQAIRPYFDAEKFYHLKNNFAPQHRYGCDRYGHYSVYSLYATSVLGLAALWADDSIAESPAPSECGNNILIIQDAFEQIYISHNNFALQYSLKADMKNDSNGLGRILLPNATEALLPWYSFVAEPTYINMSRDDIQKKNVSIAPVVELSSKKVLRYAEIPFKAKDKLETIENSKERLKFKITREDFSEEYTIEGATLTLKWKFNKNKDGKKYIELPILVSAGEKDTDIEYSKNTLVVKGNKDKIVIESKSQPQEDVLVANRSGLYRIYRYSFDEELTLKITNYSE